VAREIYTGSNAVHAHMGNMGELLGQLLALSDFELEVYGNLSEELQLAAVGLNPKVYSFFIKDHGPPLCFLPSNTCV